MPQLTMVADIQAHAGQTRLARAELEKPAPVRPAELACIRCGLHRENAGAADFLNHAQRSIFDLRSKPGVTMSAYSACPDTIGISFSSAAARCTPAKTRAVTNLSQPYWNPNSERYETLQQSIQQGRRERSLAVAAFFARWFRF